MSFLGDGNNIYALNNTAITIASNQPLLLAQWVKPISLTARLGLMHLSTTTFVNANRVGMRIEDATTVSLEWANAANSQNASAASSTGAWQHYAVYMPTGFTGASQTLRFYKNGTPIVGASVALPNFSGANFVAVTVGEGAFAENHQRTAYCAIYTAASNAAADAIVTELQTLLPTATTATALAQFPFASALPSGFAITGAGSIDAADNPPLSGGGGGPTPSSPIVINVG